MIHVSRQEGVDVLRAISIVLVVICHFILYTAPREITELGDVKELDLYFIGDQVIGYWEAPVFTFLLGFNFYQSYKKRLGYYRHRQVEFYFLRRSLLLFIIGIVMTSTVWGPMHIPEWDILFLLSFSLIFLNLLKSVGFYKKIVITIFIFVASPFLFSYFNGMERWSNMYYIAEWDMRHLIQGAFLFAYYPIFPWFGYALAGMLVSQMMLSKNKDKNKSVKRIGLMLFAIGAITRILYPYIEESYLSIWFGKFRDYPNPSLSYTAFSLGIVMVALAILDKKNIPDKAKRAKLFIFLQSKYVLTQFLLHYWVLFIPLKAFGEINHDYKFYYLNNVWFYNAMPLIAIGYIYLTTKLFQKWEEKLKGKYSVEWLIKNFTSSNQS